MSPIVSITRYNHGRFMALPGGGKGVTVSTNAHGNNELEQYHLPLNQAVAVPDAVVSVLESARYDFRLEEEKKSKKKGA